MVGSKEDTDIGGPQAAFPETSPSAILAAHSDDPVTRARGFATLVAAYWKPVYKSIRARFGKNNEDAKDLTQEFFTYALEREMFRAFEPERARFRVFVRKCLRNFVLNAETAKRRLKRGGAVMMLGVDFEEAEEELQMLPSTTVVPFEASFDRWLATSIESLALNELRQQLRERDKELYFEIFQRYDLVDDPDARPTYADLAEDLGIKTTDVTNHLAYVRRKLRQIVLQKLREITVTEEEFRNEAQEMLGPKWSEVA
jgi:RNA polymerase sigma factor (sigma-70 family)